MKYDESKHIIESKPKKKVKLIGNKHITNDIIFFNFDVVMYFTLRINI
jgi:hypothetical protein